MTDVLVPGGRDVRGTLDAGEASAVVVACPPHPRQGGHRDDRRLVAVSEALAERGIACLRFDYGPWDEGYGEREDARNAIRWTADRYDRVGVFGFSFGAAVAALASASLVSEDGPVRAASLLAPPARLGPDLEVVPALAALECPVQLCYGERDTAVDWELVVARARDFVTEVRGFSADHFFVGQHGNVTATAGEFLGSRLG